MLNKLNNIPVFCLCETWQRENIFDSYFCNHTIIFTPAIKTAILGRAKGGLIVCIRKDIKYSILSHSPNWVIIKLEMCRTLLSFCYISPNRDEDHVLDKLFDTIAVYFDPLSPCLAVGDYNARIGQSNIEEIFDDETSISLAALTQNRNSRDSVIGTRGKKLLELARELPVFSLNGQTPSDSNGEFSFVSSLGSSVIDLAFTNNKKLFDLKILNWHSSDHFPLSISLSTPSHLNSQKCLTPLVKKRLIFDVENKKCFQNYLSSITTTKTEVNSLQVEITNSILKAAEISNMVRIQTNNTSKNSPWFDSQCNAARELMNHYLIAFRKLNTDESRSKYLTTKKEFRQLLTNKKEQYLIKINKEINESKNAQDFWRIINNFYNKHSKSVTASLDKLQKHYKAIFSQNIHRYNSLLTSNIENEILDKPITLNELKNRIKLLKIKTSPGVDLIVMLS